MIEDKVQIGIYLTPETREKLDRFIARENTSSYGKISEIIEDAILKYIDIDNPSYTQIHKNRPPRGHEKAMRTLLHLRNKGFTAQFNIKEILGSIKSEIGFDYRTVKKWHRFLIENKYISSTNTRGFIYTFGPMSGFESYKGESQ